MSALIVVVASIGFGLGVANFLNSMRLLSLIYSLRRRVNRMDIPAGYRRCKACGRVGLPLEIQLHEGRAHRL